MKTPKFLIVIAAALLLVAAAGCASTEKTASTGEYIDDSVITTKVKTAIFNEPTLKTAEISVETYRGTVQLSGFVGSQANISRASELTREVPGVKTVNNDMRLK
jgi:osmotically-inducible protein OsmY